MATIAKQETLTQQLRRLTSRPCPRCNGARTVTRMETKWYGSRKSGVALTGHLIPKCYVCDACDGSGKAAV